MSTIPTYGQSKITTSQIQNKPVQDSLEKYCSQYSLTNTELFNKIKLILKHGDLLDKNFLNKTLGEPLIETKDRSIPGNANIIVYKARTVFSSPITVKLFLLQSPPFSKGKLTTQRSMYWRAILEIRDKNDYYIPNCLSIKSKQMISVFGGNPGFYEDVGQTYRQYNGVGLEKDKSGGHISVTIEQNPFSDIVVYVKIIEDLN